MRGKQRSPSFEDSLRTLNPGRITLFFLRISLPRRSLPPTPRLRRTGGVGGSEVYALERLSLNRWASPWLRHQHLARYRWASTFTRGHRVIDAACGTGYGAKMFIANGARLVDCVDNSMEAVEEVHAAATPRTRTLAADVTRLPLPADMYDVYVSFETLEHVRDDRALVEEARRVLRPDGLFICSTPNRSVISPGHSIDDRPSNPHHAREYDLGDFESLLRSCFSSIELFGQTQFGRRYSNRLNRIGKAFHMLAIRFHQVRKSLAMPWEHEDKHAPQRLPLEGEPEVFIAVCRM